MIHLIPDVFYLLDHLLKHETTTIVVSLIIVLTTKDKIKISGSIQKGDYNAVFNIEKEGKNAASKKASENSSLKRYIRNRPKNKPPRKRSK